jgi:hypothetical protein
MNQLTTYLFEQRIPNCIEQMNTSSNKLAGLAQARHGIEKECIRITREAKPATTSHPISLGSSLLHPFITTDFTEPQLEFTTAPLDTIQAICRSLEDLHTFTIDRIERELLWPLSMPPLLPAREEDIALATYGDSPLGQKKTIYRRGLGHRYGRRIQTISGVHYNFSFKEDLLNFFGPKRILSASMATVHAATGSQAVLDRLPKSGVSDLRKNRSIMNNIILTPTGAANALRLVIPEMEEIGFIAESVRVPTATGSLIILVLDLQEEMGGEPIRRDTINTIYRQAAEMDPKRYLHFSEKQNVSGDIVGYPRAATIIEGHETHTRTAEVTFDLNSIPGLPDSVLDAVKHHVYRIPITQAVIYGWYDNEMGSYFNMLGDRTVTVAEHMM